MHGAMSNLFGVYVCMHTEISWLSALSICE